MNENEGCTGGQKNSTGECARGINRDSASRRSGRAQTAEGSVGSVCSREAERWASDLQAHRDGEWFVTHMFMHTFTRKSMEGDKSSVIRPMQMLLYFPAWTITHRIEGVPRSQRPL